VKGKAMKNLISSIAVLALSSYLLGGRAPMMMGQKAPDFLTSTV
jgi:hypothetical protein